MTRSEGGMMDTWLSDAKQLIPGGAQTRSKSYLQFGEGIYPSHFKSVEGCYITDTCNNKYIDWISALGSNILGYKRVWDNETSHPSASLPSYREVELAKELKKRIPSMRMLRFATNGMDVTTCAIKLARAFTKRLPFISIGYHSCAEIFSCVMPINGGTNPKLKEDIIEFSGLEGTFRGLTLLEWLEMKTDELPVLPCAVIIEYPPIKSEEWGKVKDLSQRLQAACNKHGIILIVDEVLTFMRANDWCISNDLGITPDLTCLGKALGNGYPISAIGGREDLMQQMGENGNVFFSNTFSGFDISLSAALNCIETYSKKGVYGEYLGAEIKYFGAKMMSDLNRIGEQYSYRTEGDSFRFKIVGPDKTKEKILAQQLVKLGHLTMPSGYILPNYAHTKLNNTWIGDFREAMAKSLTEKLEGVEAKPLLLQNR